MTATGKPRILVVYATAHGSTAEVAEAIAEELREGGAEVDVGNAVTDPDPAGYDAVVLGGPMIMGWHRDAVRYLKKHEETLARLPTALFVTAISLTETGDSLVDGVSVAKDPWLAKEPGQAGRLGLKERYATPARYVGKILKKAPSVRPVQVALLGGSLDLTKLNVFQMLFVVAVVGASPGDARNWDAIRGWARALLPLLTQGPQADPS